MPTKSSKNERSMDDVLLSLGSTDATFWTFAEALATVPDDLRDRVVDCIDEMTHAEPLYAFFPDHFTRKPRPGKSASEQEWLVYWTMIVLATFAGKPGIVASYVLLRARYEMLKFRVEGTRPKTASPKRKARKAA